MIRDPERTKERILAAAIREFSAKGFSGARVDAIARRARVNKRMLYHYFGNKEHLFREILRCKIAYRASILDAPGTDPADRLARYHEVACHDVDWVRLLQWEALTAGNRKVIGEDERRELFASKVDEIRAEQAAGRLSCDLDPEQLFLSFVALASFPLAFPQQTRLITGLAPTDPEFQKRRSEFLRDLVEHLRTPPSHPQEGKDSHHAH